MPSRRESKIILLQSPFTTCITTFAEFIRRFASLLRWPPGSPITLGRSLNWSLCLDERSRLLALNPRTRLYGFGDILWRDVSGQYSSYPVNRLACMIGHSWFNVLLPQSSQFVHIL